MTVAASFSERFSLASVDDADGVLVDLVTGEIYRVDGSGLVACRALAQGAGVAGAAAALTQHFAVSSAQAMLDVQVLLASFATAARRPQHARPIAFRVAGDGFDMFVERRRRLHIVRATGRVEASGRNRSLLRFVAPHVLALHGHTVLHASAVRIGRKLVAFMGPSGVGKTTIAKVLRSGGARLVSRDLVVMVDARRALVDGESAIVAWSRRRARIIDARPVDLASGGPSNLLGAIFVVERGTPGSTLRIDELHGAAAIAALLENAFVELPDRHVWASALASCAAIAAQGLVRRARVPEGRADLRRELTAWVEAGAPVRRRT